MDSLQIQDVFDPYYVGRKPFLPKTLQPPTAVKTRKNAGKKKPRDGKDKDETTANRGSL